MPNELSSKSDASPNDVPLRVDASVPKWEVEEQGPGAGTLFISAPKTLTVVVVALSAGLLGLLGLVHQQARETQSKVESLLVAQARLEERLANATRETARLDQQMQEKLQLILRRADKPGSDGTPLPALQRVRTPTPNKASQK